MLSRVPKIILILNTLIALLLSCNPLTSEFDSLPAPTIAIPSSSPTPSVESYSCESDHLNPYYCEPVVPVGMFYIIDGINMGGTIGYVSCADAWKFQPLNTLPENRFAERPDYPSMVAVWSWAYENDVTVFTDAQYDEIHPVADPKNIIFSPPVDKLLEYYPQCAPTNK